MSNALHYILKIVFFGFVSLLINGTIYAQNVGINGDGSAPNNSAGLDLKFTDKGLLIPRVTINNLTLASPVTSPAEGLLVYNQFGTAAKGFYYWDGTKWILLSTGGQAWSVTGNASTLDGTNFLGTTDNVPLNFRINNVKAGRIGTSTDNSVFFGIQAGNSDDQTDNRNVGIGYQALYNNTSGSNNIANGYQSMYTNTNGSGNIANGYRALFNNTIGLNNTASGFEALHNNTTGGNNYANGNKALRSNTIGNHNFANGFEAFMNNTSGNDNFANGYRSLHNSTTGNSNIGIGTQSLIHNTTGSDNLGTGLMALFQNTTGTDNIALGHRTLSDNVSGNYNIGLGRSALFYNQTGNHNIALGVDAGVGILNGSNNIVIGNNAQVISGAASNQVRIGNTAVTSAACQVAWTITSDRRWKSEIQNIPLGLSFINALRPVVYFRNNDEQKQLEYGFIAQEIEEALQNVHVNPAGIISIDDKGMYGVRYNDFIAPMVKSIQELSVENEALKAKNSALEKRLERLESLIK